MHKKFTELWHAIKSRKSISMSYDNLLIYVVFKTGLYIITDILCGITRPITNHRKFKYSLCLRFWKRHCNTKCFIIHNLYIITSSERGKRNLKVNYDIDCVTHEWYREKIAISSRLMQWVLVTKFTKTDLHYERFEKSRESSVLPVWHCGWFFSFLLY